MDLAGEGAIEDDATVDELFFALDDCGQRRRAKLNQRGNHGRSTFISARQRTQQHPKRDPHPCGL